MTKQEMEDKIRELETRIKMLEENHFYYPIIYNPWYPVNPQYPPTGPFYITSGGNK